MTGRKDAGLVDDGMEEKEENVHGRGRRGVGSRSSVISAALVVRETKAPLEVVYSSDRRGHCWSLRWIRICWLLRSRTGTIRTCRRG